MNINSYFRFQHIKTKYIEIFNETYSQFQLTYKDGILNIDYYYSHNNKRDFILIIRYNFYYSRHYKVRLTSKGIKIMDITKQAAFKYDVPMDFKTSKKIIRFVKKRCLKQFYIISFGL